MTRHCLDIETCLDASRYCVDTSTHCLDTLMIALGNGLERKKIIYMLYNGLERNVSVCN